MMASRVGQTGERHPFCPSCEYDLVATVDVGGHVCPECGYDFEVSELKREVKPGDWTPMRGLGKGAGVLALRAIVVLVVWSGLLWCVTVPAGLLAAGRNVRVVAVILAVTAAILAFTAAAMGHWMAGRMEEYAGTTSMAVAAVICVFTWMAIIGGSVIVALISPLGAEGAEGAAIVGCGFSMFWIVRRHMFSE